MKEAKSQKKYSVVSIVLAVLLVLSIAGSGFLYSNSQNKISTLATGVDLVKQDTGRQLKAQNEFFEDYSIALNDLWRADLLLTLGLANELVASDYTLRPDYDYYGAQNLYDSSKSQLKESEGVYKKAQNKLMQIKDEAPSEFFREDINMRLKYVNLRVEVAEKAYVWVNLWSEYLSELNLGSALKADDLYRKANGIALSEFNDVLEQSTDASNAIDLHWDQDWYGEFQG
jgi:hypothetical protein